MPAEPIVDRRSAKEKIYDALHNGAELTYGAMAELADCDTRHCRRIIGELHDEGSAIEVVREGRLNVYRIPEEKREVGMRINLSEQEMQALMIAANASLSSLGPTPLASAMRQAIDRLTERMRGEFYTFDPEEHDQHWHFNATPSSTLDPDIFSILQGAIEECETLGVRYFTATRLEESDRKLDPYALAAPGGSWQLLAWCHTRRDFRIFSLAGIRSAAPTGDHFTRRTIDVQAQFADNLGGVGGDRLYTIRLQVSPDCVPAFRRKQYHHSQQIEESADGSATVTFRVAGLEDIRSFVLGFGDGVRVIEPTELVERVREEVRLLGRMYGDGVG